MDNLTLVIPAKNESESLPQVLDDLIKFKLKTIIVLEKEDIKTIESINKYQNIIILYQKNKGYGDALIEGINKVNTEYFCIFNADGSFLSSELKKMHNLLNDNSTDFVFGSRYMPGASSEDDTIVTLIGNKLFSFIGNFFFFLGISDILYTYVMGSTQKAKYLDLKSKDFAFCVELPIKAKKNDYRLVSSPSNEKPRIAGKKKVNAFKDGFMILIAMIKLFFFNKSKIK